MDPGKGWWLCVSAWPRLRIVMGVVGMASGLLWGLMWFTTKRRRPPLVKEQDGWPKSRPRPVWPVPLSLPGHPLPRTNLCPVSRSESPEVEEVPPGIWDRCQVRLKCQPAVQSQESKRTR